jgi:hypothetical protein
MTEDVEKLKATLLNHGGTEISVHDGDSARRIAQYGTLVAPQRVEAYPGETGECHKNALDLVERRADLVVWTGFALMGDVWVRHSWLMAGDGTLIETTVQGSRYFGMALAGVELQVFADRVNGPRPELVAKILGVLRQ